MITNILPNSQEEVVHQPTEQHKVKDEEKSVALSAVQLFNKESLAKMNKKPAHRTDEEIEKLVNENIRRCARPQRSQRKAKVEALRRIFRTSQTTEKKCRRKRKPKVNSPKVKSAKVKISKTIIEEKPVVTKEKEEPKECEE